VGFGCRWCAQLGAVFFNLSIAGGFPRAWTPPQTPTPQAWHSPLLVSGWRTKTASAASFVKKCEPAYDPDPARSSLAAHPVARICACSKDPSAFGMRFALFDF